jgi:hypothetical protein
MATAAAAMVARARREVENLFFDNDAFSPDRAVEFDLSMPIQRRYLEQLIGEGVVHQLESGRYWFDLPAYKELKRQRLVWSMRVLGFAAIVFVVILIIRMAMHLR